MQILKDLKNLNIEFTVTIIPENLNDEGLREAYADANKNTWTKEELAAYDYATMREQDEKGREQKAEQKKEAELVIEFWKNGVPIEIIAISTKLTVEQVQEIIKEQEKKA